jgi:Protein of unknown function (DUF2408)
MFYLLCSLSDAPPHTLSLLGTRSKRVDGKFLGPSGNIPASQAICTSLLEECFDIVQEIRAQEESKNVAPPLKPIHDRLMGLRAELEGLALTHRWTLRETDLWNYSLSLQEVDKMRIDGKFVDSEGNRPAGQYVCLALTERRIRVLTTYQRFFSTSFDVAMVSFICCCPRASLCLRSLCRS